MGWTEIISFTIVATLLVISPGPNGVLIAKTVPASGRAAGFSNVAGFVAAFYLHGALAILGLSILLVQSATAFAIVKYLGAAYLFWIGAKALWAAWRGVEAPDAVAPARSRRTLARAFVEGFVTNALNPKVSMFYLAAFPQFIPLADTPASTSFLLVTIHCAVNALWFGAMVMLFSTLVGVARRGAVQRWIKGITGIVFIGFAAKLATTRANI